MLHPLAAAVTVVLLAANPPPPGDAPATDTPRASGPSGGPIVGGRHIQPRASATQIGPNASNRDSDEVERLYQELMRQTAPGTSQVRSVTAPQ